MGILSWIVVGLIAGFLASRVMRGRGYGLVGDPAVTTQRFTGRPGCPLRLLAGADSLRETNLGGATAAGVSESGCLLARLSNRLVQDLLYYQHAGD